MSVKYVLIKKYESKFNYSFFFNFKNLCIVSAKNNDKTKNKLEPRINLTETTSQ